MARRNRLSAEARAHIDKVADSAATLQLAAEEAARRLTAVPVARAAERLVARVAVAVPDAASAKRQVFGEIRQAQQQLEADFASAMREARSIAREIAARQLAVEAEPLLGLPEHALVTGPLLAAEEVEALWAEQAALSMARKFGSAAIAETTAWQASRAGVEKLPRALSRVAERLEPERKLHAVTQSVGAFNEAKRERWKALRDDEKQRAKTLSGIPGYPPKEGRPAGGGQRPPIQTAFELWSAALDVKTCPVCWGLDGKMVRLGEPFPEGARCPLHSHCRCSCVTVFLGSELERYLAGYELDYEAFKDDVADYMSSRTFDVGEGARHARRFVDEMFSKRYPSQEHSPMAGSALVLTRRMSDRAAYFPNLVRSRAPRLRW